VTAPVSMVKVSPEFFARVNEILAAANSVAQQHSIPHAQMAMLHAMARYGAFHYLRATEEDSAELRESFSRELGNLLSDLVARNIKDMAASARGAAGAGKAPGAGPSASTDAPAAGEE
jgi:hypothetical protein